MARKTMLGLVVLTAILAWSAGAPAQTAEGWRKDIDLLVTKIERYHPRPWAKVSREEFLQRAQALKRDLGQWERERVFVETMKLVGILRDGHTEVLFANQERFNLWFPIRMERFQDGVFVTAADSAHAEYLGGRVTRIGKVSADEAFRRVAEIVPRDSDHGIDRFGTDYLSNAVLLKQLGIVDDERRLELSFLAADGTEKRTVLESAKWQMWFHWSWGKTNVPTDAKTRSVFDDRLDRLPLYLKNVIPLRNSYYFEFLPGDRMLYFQFNAVNNWKKDPLRDFTQRMFKTFDENASGIDKFVIDLRFNEGGNGALLPPLVEEFIRREKDLGRGRLVILTGNHTFSAATNFIGQMLKYTNAVTVGDIAAGPLNWCSDTQEFLLPNSRVVVNISTMYWQTGHPKDDRGYYPPDCYLPATFKDYISCFDPVLAAVKNGTAVSLKQILVDKGVDAFLAEVDREKALYGNVEAWFPYTSYSLMNTAYYDLAGRGKKDDALKLAKWNAVLYPKDVMAWYGLAEIAKGVGNTKEALRGYEKVLALEPGFWEAAGERNGLLLLDAYETDGAKGFADKVEEMRKGDPLSVSERMVNEFGYRILGNSKFQDAIQIFALNVRLYPQSANAYDSLGEAYMKAGDKASAITNYEKSLELNPGSAGAKKALEELRKP